MKVPHHTLLTLAIGLCYLILQNPGPSQYLKYLAETWPSDAVFALQSVPLGELEALICQEQGIDSASACQAFMQEAKQDGAMARQQLAQTALGDRVQQQNWVIGSTYTLRARDLQVWDCPATHGERGLKNYYVKAVIPTQKLDAAASNGCVGYRSQPQYLLRRVGILGWFW